MKTMFFLCFLLATKCFGQISGKIVSSEGEAVPFANVILFQSKDSTIESGSSADEHGAFLINHSKTGEFFVQISSIGYKTFLSPSFVIHETSQNILLGEMVLLHEGNALDEVVVAAQKDLIQSTPLGKIIHIQSSLMTKGSNALQVLERLPGVILDRRNNQFSLNGQNGLTILFNGRKMPMSVEELMILLESTIADNIEKIELITSPTAQYDADGGAGIINIVFKNEEILGTKINFSATAGYGFREKAVTSLGLSQGFKKLNLHASYAFLRDVGHSGYAGDGTNNNPNIGGETWNTFSGFTKRFQNTQNTGFTLEYQPNTKTTLGSDVSFSWLKAHNLVDNEVAWDVKDAEYVRMDALSDGYNTRRNLISSMYFRRKITAKSQLSFDASYITFYNNSPNTILASYFDRENHEIDPQNPIFTSGNRGQSISKIQVGVLKADYSLEIHAKVQLEAGVKGSLAKNTNDSQVERNINGNWEIDPRSQSTINSQEKIWAAYTQFKFTPNTKSTFQAGLRYEYWNRDINIYENAFRIANFFPILNYSLNLSENSTISFNYNRRISRPAYADLISNLFYNDPTFVFSGNPLLKPTLTDVFKVDFNTSDCTLGLSYQSDIHPILRYQITTNETQDIGISSPQNLDYQRSINLFLNIPIQFFKWWKFSWSSTTSMRHYKVSYSLSPAEKTYLYQNINFTQHFTLPKSFEIELSGWYNFAFYDGTSKLKGFGVVNLGIAKKLKKDWGTIQLALPDLFRSFGVRTHIGALTPIAFDIQGQSTWKDETTLYRVIKLTYSRSFGKNTRSIHYNADDEERERVKR
ncbi:MAG: outer membrane beta-barrel protein [Microscillaceae bacterium]|nr:outer membrane beta-barrel protein [Microscillaceae bacterium]